MSLFAILVSMILVNNYVLAQFLGICPFLGVSKKLDSALGMGIAVIFVMVLATAATWPIQYVMDQLGIGYLQTIVFILVIAALVQFVEMALKKFIPSLHKALGVYLPLITTNCAVLGSAILGIQRQYDFLLATFYGFTAGLSFMFAIVLFSGIRERIELCNIPKPFRGFPIALIAASLLSIAFTGFSGLKIF